MSKASPYTAAQLLLWRRLYGFNGWAVEPPAIVGLLYAPALFNVTATDAVCQVNPVTGFSSGADGEACVPFGLWNNTLWRSVGGEACFNAPGFLVEPYYVVDPALDGCIDAFDAYRNATAADGGVRFTCNCSGPNADHAFLAGSTRPGAVLTTMTSIGNALCGVLALPVGAWTDTRSRKKMWWTLSAMCVVCFFGSAVLGTGYVWVVSVAAGAILSATSDLSAIPRQSYLDLFPLDEQGAIIGCRGSWAYGSHLLFAILGAVLTLFGPNQVTSATILWVIVGLWYGIQQFVVLYKFPDVVGICKTERGILGQCWHTVVGSLKGHPEACKYLVAIFFTQNGGPAAVVLVATNYLLNYLAVSGFQNQVLFAILLILAVPSSAAFGCATKKFSYKAIWIFLLAILAAFAVAVPLIWVRPPARARARRNSPAEPRPLAAPATAQSRPIGPGNWNLDWIIFLAIIAPTLAILLPWYFALWWTALLPLIPEDKVSQYGGMFTFVRLAGIVVYPSIFTAMVQVDNNLQRTGLFFLAPWAFVGILFFVWVDWRKGMIEAGRLPADAPKVKWWKPIKLAKDSTTEAPL